MKKIALITAVVGVLNVLPVNIVRGMDVEEAAYQEALRITAPLQEVVDGIHGAGQNTNSLDDYNLAVDNIINSYNADSDLSLILDTAYCHNDGSWQVIKKRLSAKIENLVQMLTDYFIANPS